MNLGGLLGMIPGLREALAAIVVEVSNDLVSIKMDGQQRVLAVRISDRATDRVALEAAFADCMTRVLSESREKAKVQLEKQLGVKLPI